MKRIIIARNVATVATCLVVLGYILLMKDIRIGDGIGVIGIILGIISYVLGGLGTALKKVWKIAVTGWYLVPIFPADVCVFFVTMGMALLVFLYFPIIPIMMAYKEKMSSVEA